MKTIDQRLARLENVVAETVKGLPLCVYFVDANGDTDKAQAIEKYREEYNADPEDFLAISFVSRRKGASL